MHATHDSAGNITIEYNSQGEAILSPDGTQQLLPCRLCRKLIWVNLNVVSAPCQNCGDWLTHFDTCMEPDCERCFEGNPRKQVRRAWGSNPNLIDGDVAIQLRRLEKALG